MLMIGCHRRNGVAMDLPTSTTKRIPSRDLKQDMAFLKQVQLFSDLSEEEMVALLDIVFLRTFKKGDTIIREDDVGSEMYVLVEGEVQVVRSLTLKVGRHEFEQTEKALTRLSGKKPICFGEMAMLSQDKRSASIMALANCTAFVIERERFEQFCETNPRAGYHVVRRIAQVVSDRLRKENENVLKLTTALSLALARG